MPNLIFGSSLMFFISVIFNLSSLDAFSQEKGLKFFNYSTEDGLSQSSVTDILQDDEGFLWFGTYAGLNRFDGNNFIVYLHSLTDSTSISENSIKSICQDSTGILFIGTTNGLDRFFTHTNDFIHFTNDSTNPNSLSNNTIYKVFKDSQGDVWVGTWGGGLDKMERIRGNYKNEKEVKYKFVHYKPIEGKNSISSLFINDIIEAKDGSLWIATNDGLNHFDKKTKTFICYKNDPKNPNSLCNNNICSVCFDKKGNIWAGSWGSGISVIDPKTNEIVTFKHNQQDKLSLSHDIVIKLYCDKSGNIWVGTFIGGLNRVIIDDNNYLKISELKNKTHFISSHHIENDYTSISSNTVNDIFEDCTGVMWAGTSWGGVVKFEKVNTKFKHIYSETNSKNTLAVNIVFSLLSDRKGLLWMGTPKGLNTYNRKNNKFELFLNNPKDPNTLSTNNIRSVAEDNKGNIWVGTIFGLNKYIPGTGKFKRYIFDSQNQNLNLIHYILPAHDGKIWIGTFNAGLQMFNPKTEKYHSYLKNAKNPYGISDNLINCIVEDKQGLLWIATRSNGLVAYNPLTNKSISYLNNPTDKFSLSYNNVSALYFDHAGNLWIGTSVGLNKRIVDKNGKVSFKKYYAKDGLSSDGVCGIVEDEFNQIWITTQKGICRLNPETDEFINFKKEDGLQGMEFCLNSIAIDKNTGDLFAGGTNGFNIFNPKKMQNNNKPPLAKIVDLKISNKPVSIGEVINGHIILKQQISSLKSINLSYKENVITFEFAALHFQSPKRNKYAFKLVGFEKDWNYVGNQRTATYTNLEPGTYTFVLKAANTFNNWSKPIELKIYIKPPWWNTIYSKILFILVIIAAIWIFIWLRFKLLTTQKKNLEEMVIQRTEALSDANVQLKEKQEEISIQNEELTQHRLYLEKLVDERTVQLIEAKEKAEESDKLKSAFLANMSHEVRTPMNAIIGFSSLLENSVVDEKERNSMLKIIINNGEALVTLINDILDISMIESDQLVLHKELFCVDDILLEIQKYFSLVNDKSIEIQYDNFNYNQKTILSNDAVRFRQIITNLVSNAVKFTEKGYVKFGYEIKNNHAEFYVEDTGIGIDIKDQANIFNYFYKIEVKRNKIYRGTGIGLSISKRLVDLMGGELKLISESEKGSKFYFALPIIENSQVNTDLSKKDLNLKINLKNVSVVVAEDEPTNFELINKILLFSGANILWAHNGKEAVDIVKDNFQEKKCIVLMDIKMPEMDGIKANSYIKKINKSIPVIALTAYAQVDDRRKIMQHHFDEYISKPINPKKLLEILAFFSSKISI